MEVLLQCAGGPVKQVAGGVCDGQQLIQRLFLVLDRTFATHGIQEEVVHDGGGDMPGRRGLTRSMFGPS